MLLEVKNAELKDGKFLGRDFCESAFRHKSKAKQEPFPYLTSCTLSFTYEEVL